MQINRLFEIVYLLLHKKNITARDLSERFEVSQRTIYRDVETLCQAGIPIITNKGKGGGISLMDNFTLNKSVLSEEERGEILSALQGLQATGFSEADQVLSKLSALFGTNAPNWVEIDFSDWSDTQQHKFSQVKEAVLRKKVLSFDYYSSYGEKTRRIAEPLQLWFKGRTWYVRAYCRSKQNMRTFKLTRMKNLAIIEETFDRALPSDESPSATSHPQEHPVVTIRLKVDFSQAFRVYDEFDETEITKDADGSFLITVSYPDDDWVYGHLLSFGPHVEVLEPARVRENLIVWLRKTLERYS
ncbi:helix-turn-helix transcriptional regulator [Paenibacillus cymbidii]|uniref:helix-turn-helix transcriptional regulator n=1 Tax=Paenibacillus cymbidii TaxID=1639034 RepID=UPI00108197CD|nr:YafY family protein [Paenibacillus cymbidii]